MWVEVFPPGSASQTLVFFQKSWSLLWLLQQEVQPLLPGAGCVQGQRPIQMLVIFWQRRFKAVIHQW